MPDYYAHLTYGAQVLTLLEPALRDRLERERDAFDIGLFGPDPLFFYHPLRQEPARLEAMQMHHESAKPVLERLRQAAAKGTPYAASYAAGFLCHFMLDSACHPYILRQVRTSGLHHLAIEGEFDRCLMRRDGVRNLRRPAMKRYKMPPAFYRAAVGAYPAATPAVFQKALDDFWRTTRLMAILAGTPVHRFVNWSSRRLEYLSELYGVVLGKYPAPFSIKTNVTLAQLLQNSIVPGAEQVAAFFRAVETGCPLDGRLLPDFSGNNPQPTAKIG